MSVTSVTNALKRYRLTWKHIILSHEKCKLHLYTQYITILIFIKHLEFYYENWSHITSLIILL